MSTIDPREEALFAAALELPSAERAAFLAAECGDNAALRSGVASLLSIHDSEFGILDRAPLGWETAETAFSAGDVIGPYTLAEEIGSGGMGVVFRAEQMAPVRREVALKLIKPGMDTRSVIARFEGERQALALLDHPAITKVFDAGATPTGRPYFVMELCRGTCITAYCREKDLPLEERLLLIARVCDAIEHAHQKGILHRDLKPSNVLVTEEEGRATPKVIDFGVAKALTTSLAGETLVTHAGQVIGTPEYTSPEQSENGLDVDTRSDVYSLGVLLYELLTGVTPTAALGVTGSKVLEAIRTEDPPAPSLQLRRTDAPTLAKRCRGEIDWIVARALEKNRADRYQSAAELARDLRGHLTGAVVHAAAPSVGYRMRKAFDRHRAAVVTSGLIATILLAATVISTTLALRLDDSLGKTRVERDRAIKAEQKLAALERDQRNKAAVYRALARYAEDTFFGRSRPASTVRPPTIDEAAAAILEDLRAPESGSGEIGISIGNGNTPITLESIAQLIRDAHGRVEHEIEFTMDPFPAGDLGDLGDLGDFGDPSLGGRIGRAEWGPVRVETANVHLFFEGIDLSADFEIDTLLKTLPQRAVTLILEEQKRAFGEDDPIIEATLEEIDRARSGSEHPLDSLIESLDDPAPSSSP